jgi:hypothetical protein
MTRVNLIDRLFEKLSKLIVRAGLPLGEEIIVRVEKEALRGEKP